MVIFFSFSSLSFLAVINMTWLSFHVSKEVDIFLFNT